MPQYVIANGRLNLAENPKRAVLSGLVESHGSDNQTLTASLSIGNAARAAAQSQFKQIGIEVFLDRGTGIMEQIPNSEIGNDLSIKEDLDAYSDTLTVSLLGTKYAPWVSTLIRGQRQVQVFMSCGSPGNHFYSLIFDGYTQSGSFKFTPPVATVVCMDKAIKYAQDPIDYNLPVNSGKSRLEILFALINQGYHGAVPTGTIDIGGDGGKINKSFSTGPETRRFDLIRDAICGPTGSRLFFANGQMHITRFNPRPPVDRILTRRDIAIPFQQTVPNASDYNSVSVTTVNFVSADANGNRVETQTETVVKAFSRASWVLGMSAGVTFPNLSPAQEPATEKEFSRTITTNTYKGSVLIYSQVDEYGWFSPRVAVRQLNPPIGDADPKVTTRDSGIFYQYADGTWHLDSAERYRLIRRTITKKVFGASGTQYYSSLGEPTTTTTGTSSQFDHSIYVIGQTEDRYFYHVIGQAPLVVFENGDHLLSETVPGTTPIPVDENGRGVLYGQESIGLVSQLGNTMESGLAAQVGLSHPDSSTYTSWDLVTDPLGTNDGAIKSQTILEVSFGAGGALYQTQIGAYRYGLQDKVYFTLPFEVFSGAQTTRRITYTQVDDETYSISDVVDDGSSSGPVRKNSTGQGALPRAEAIQPSTQSQQVQTTVSDAFRVMVSGYIPETLHNEYCENAFETRTFALTTLRELSAWTVTIPMPLEGQIHKTSVLMIEGLPEIGADGMVLQVTQVQRDFGKFRQTVVAKYYPPEVIYL